MNPVTVVLLSVFGGLGALARYSVSGWVQRRLDARSRSSGPLRPWGTMVVNLLGNGLLAALIAGRQHGLVAEQALTLAGAGFCGGLTTFSTWMFDTVRLSEAGHAGRRAAATELAGQLLAGVVMVAGLVVL